jgi:hypothetical protein
MSHEKANLTRIRHNQQRLRARRKEYLQELEARLRQIELGGVGVSSEIHLAARRVVDENKKLRTLLAQHGVGNDSIEACLQSNPINGPDARTGEQFNTASNHGTVQISEHLLRTRIKCGGDANTGASIATTVGADYRRQRRSVVRNITSFCNS